MNPVSPPRAFRHSAVRRRTVLLAQSWWQDRILRGVADYAAKHDWDLQSLMHWTHRVPDEWKGDGIIVYAGISRWMKNLSRSLISFVKSANVPVVDLQAYGDTFQAPHVALSNVKIGRMAAEHFIGIGYQDCGYVAFDDNPIEADRQRGFREAVEEAGARFHSLTLRGLRRSIATLPRPLALFALNDPNALQVILICRDAGYHVPEEFAVIGVDDTDIICDMAAVPLSSVDAGFEDQGYQAAALLDRMMDGDRDIPPVTAIAPKGVTVRRSTDTVAIPDLDAARVLRALRDRYCDGSNVQQILSDLDVPVRRIHEIFRRYVGRTMLQELTRLRIEHAKKLFADPKLKLETIAHESGFANRFHFVKAFRRTTGVAPRAYRNRLLDAD